MGFDPVGAVSSLFGGGGGGGGGSDSYARYLDWIIDNQQRLEELEGRELERAETVVDYRRGEVLDRTGFAGLVNVGDAVRRTDETLAAEMAQLASDDPQRVAYEAAIAQEAEEGALSRRIITGEQYEAEDALADIRAQFDEFQSGGTPSWRDTGRYGEFLSELEQLQDQYGFLDVSGLAGDVEAGLTAEEEARRRRLDRLNSRDNEFGSENSGGF